MADQEPQVRVGVVGAGPWATLLHAPMLAASGATELSGVWARRPAAAAELARRNGTTAYASFDELLEHVDALAFAVPPDVQAELAIAGARAGKALLLEKPLALDLGRAGELAAAVDAAGVPTQMVLTWRYAAVVRSFLDAVAATTPLGGRGCFLTGGLLGGMFATPWRIEQGPLFDLGPHVLDLLDAALGPIVAVEARGDLHRWIGLECTHASGVVSEASLTAYSRLAKVRAGVEVYGPDGVCEVDTDGVSADAAPRIAAEFAGVVRSGRPHLLDVHRGLHLQRLVDGAAAALR